MSSDRTRTADPDALATIRREPVAATLTTADGRWQLTMERELRHPPESVWPMLTDPARLREWSPIDLTGPLAPGLTVTEASTQMPAQELEVLRMVEPVELVCRWGTDLLRWTLIPTAAGCCLVLEHTFDDVAQRGSFAAGWHLCLAVLGSRLEGRDTERIVGERAMDYGWADLRSGYDAVLG